MAGEKFWETTPLTKMTAEQWESLCDGCAKCCLIKLEDEDDGAIAYTNVVCQYMDEANCQCTQYQQRNDLVPDCVWLKPDMIDEFFWLPDTCAYKLLAAGEPLPSWHPLISGDQSSVHTAGQSVKDKVINEQYVHLDDLEEYIVHWV